MEIEEDSRIRKSESGALLGGIVSHEPTPVLRGGLYRESKSVARSVSVLVRLDRERSWAYR